MSGEKGGSGGRWYARDFESFWGVVGRGGDVDGDGVGGGCRVGGRSGGF